MKESERLAKELEQLRTDRVEAEKIASLQAQIKDEKTKMKKFKPKGLLDKAAQIGENLKDMI